MLCPVCRTGTMSETRPYVWSCSLCGNTEFKPNESSSYARSEDTSTSSSYTNSYDTGSSYTSSYDTSSSYGAPNYSYGGSGSRGSYNSGKHNSRKHNAINYLATILGCVLGGVLYLLLGLKSLPVFLIAIFFWDKVGFFGKFAVVLITLLICYIAVMSH